MRQVYTILAMVTKRRELILLAILALALVLGGCVAPPPVPPPPSNLTVTAVSSQQIDLAWKDNSRIEKGFYVYRRAIGGYGRIVALDPNATSYSDSSLSPGTTYWYKVSAYNDGGESAQSNEINITTPLPEWHLLLRPEFRPTEERISRLETLRAKYEIPSEVFALCISSYPGATRLLQINLYKQAKEKWPDLSEKDLLRGVFVGRALKPEPYGYGMTVEEFDKVMEKINSLEELCDYVAFKDSKEPEYELDLTEWEKYVDMLKEAGIGADIDWERHKNNVRRMKEDNVKEKINVILEDEVEKALSETKVRVSRKEFAEALYLWLSMSLTEEAVRQAAEGFDFEIKNDEDLSRMFEGLFLLNMWLTVYTCEREFEDEEKRNECLDMFHTLVYESYVDWDVMDFVEWMNSIGVLYIEYDSAMNIHHPSGPLWVVAKTFNRNLFGEVEEDVFVQMGIVVHIGTFIEHLGEAIRQYDVE